ncbi:diguanylate cyclase [Agrobacterium rubi]|uniref:diguanylate cyclase n=1 Tax=Agrobacterium rubi TaxID=28099 RepID=UPI001571DC43|nr:diguanylate cyclase [Agrobacterium rubi]NTF10697.1 diguanylate cyclase [Agrobacterium rubi]NTF23091.1 diguanylate cyclase [Agrobacterium rubi]NTF30022.1 diguanylate cyclase [Agrobacterium rubi]
MIILRHMGVRSRMIALISAAILPFAAVIGVGIAYSYDEADKDARQTVAYDAQLGAARFSRIFLDAKVVLGTLRGMPPLQTQHRPRCDTFIQKVLSNQPMFVTMGIISADGNIVCHNKPDANGKFGDQGLSEKMANAPPDELVVGRFMIGPVSKKPTVAVAMRLPDGQNGEKLSIFGSLDLERFEQLAKSIAGQTNHTVALIETSNQRVLVRWPNIVPFGTAFPNHPLINDLSKHPDGGTTFSIGFDHVPRFFGFAPVADAVGSNLAVTLGLPEDEAFLTVKERSDWAVAVSFAAFLIALGLTAAIAYFTQLRPIRRLSQMSERIGNGDFGTPVSVERWQAMEFRGLANSLNKSAEKLAAAHEAERKTVESERRFRLVTDNTADMITTVDQSGNRTFVSGACREILGYEPDELIGQDPLALVLDDDRALAASFFQRLKKAKSGLNEQYRVCRRDGVTLWVEVSGRRMVDDSGTVFTMRNITKRKTVEAELEAANDRLSRLATTDELTGLNNRREFNRVLDIETKRSQREGSNLCVLLIDVDRFKPFNDIYGHPEGDACLRQVATAISGALRRPGDFCARYGGEEFVVVLPNTSWDGGRDRAEKIRRAVAELGIVHTGSEAGLVTISVGLAFTNKRVQLAAGPLLKRADEALYSAKAGGRNRIVSFNDLKVTPLKTDDRR